MDVRYGHDNTHAMRIKLDVLMARFPWVEMVVFSELAAFGASLYHAQELPGPIEELFSEMARKHSVWLIPGSVFERSDDRIYNTSPVFDPTGALIGRYRKMFPFRPYEEGVSAGTEFMVFDVHGVGRFGMSICYDMWFPETIRTLACMGAEVILHPSLTDTIEGDVELSIARASAAVNQCFLFDVNGVGHGGTGRSTVIRPTGTVMYCAGNGEELIPIDMDPAVARRCRATGMFGLGQTLKSFRDRDVDLSIYGAASPVQHYLESLGPLVKPARHPLGAQPRPPHPPLESIELYWAFPGAAVFDHLRILVERGDFRQLAQTVNRIVRALSSPELPAPGHIPDRYRRCLPGHGCLAGRHRRGAQLDLPEGLLSAGRLSRVAPEPDARRAAPAKDPVLQGAAKIRGTADGRLSRDAHFAREVDHQVALDPGHGPVLRDEHFPGGNLGNLGRSGQFARPARTDQGSPGNGGSSLRLAPHVLRHQRHHGREQDRQPGPGPAGRHRPHRP